MKDSLPAAAVTSPVSQPSAEPESLREIRDQMKAIQMQLEGMQAMVKENASMVRSVMETIQSSHVSSNPFSSPSTSTALNAERARKSGKRESSGGNESSDISLLNECPEYAKMVNELGRSMSSFRVSLSLHSQTLTC